MRRKFGENPNAGNGNVGAAIPGDGTNSADNGSIGETVNPATASGINTAAVPEGGGNDTAESRDATSGRKRRADAGKRRGPRGANRQAASLDVDAISAILVSSHMMLAKATSTPELVMSPDEAEQLAKAGAHVASFYNTVIDPKTLAWINLMQVAGLVYGTRLFAIRARRNEERARARAARPAPITPTPQPARTVNGTGAAQPARGMPQQTQADPNNPLGISPSDLNNVN